MGFSLFAWQPVEAGRSDSDAANSRWLLRACAEIATLLFWSLIALLLACFMC